MLRHTTEKQSPTDRDKAVSLITFGPAAVNWTQSQSGCPDIFSLIWAIHLGLENKANLFKLQPSFSSSGFSHFRSSVYCDIPLDCSALQGMVYTSRQLPALKSYF